MGLQIIDLGTSSFLPDLYRDSMAMGQFNALLLAAAVAVSAQRQVTVYQDGHIYPPDIDGVSFF
jgi:hypothetical protein